MECVVLHYEGSFEMCRRSRFAGVAVWDSGVGMDSLQTFGVTTMSLRWEEKENGFVKIEAVEFTGRNP